jgi:hypothetical protein
LLLQVGRLWLNNFILLVASHLSYYHKRDVCGSIGEHDRTGGLKQRFVCCINDVLDLMKSHLKFIIAILTIIALLAIGYLKSDDVFYNKLLNTNKLKTPVEVFNWVTRHYGLSRSDIVQSNVSPRYLIENHPRLWCDEAATIMATLDHKLGYHTRLVDLYGFDNVSHHTVLQVLEQNEWITYDFTNRIYNNELSKSASDLGYVLKEPRIKPYPKLYNALVNNNYFFKQMAFTIRGIKE